MPDSAFEQQFIGLLESAAHEIGGTKVHFSRYTLPGLARSAAIERRCARDYRPVDHLYGGRADGLIVTGTEPLTDDLRTESYWGALAELIGWAEGSVASALLSCLAAHAAALLFDGIERETLPAKCSGIFVQGHPEYSTTSLLREYRRDLVRFLRGERKVVPAVPVGYVDDESRRLLESFEAQVLARPTDPELMRRFPLEPVAQRLVNTWQLSGARLYANWLRLIQHRRQYGA